MEFHVMNRSTLFEVSISDVMGTRVGQSVLLAPVVPVFACLLAGSTAIYAQSNPGGLGFTGDAFGDVTKYEVIDSSAKEDVFTTELWVKHNAESDEDAALLGDTLNLGGNGYALQEGYNLYRSTSSGVEAS